MLKAQLRSENLYAKSTSVTHNIINHEPRKPLVQYHPST